MTLADLIDLVTRGGSTALFLIVIWAFYTDRIVTAKTYRRILSERDEFKREWADALRLAGRAANVADKALAGKEEQHGGRIQAQQRVRTIRDNNDDDG